MTYDLKSLIRESRQHCNEELGMYCYWKEGQEHLWSLWADSDDIQLTPWLDLGLDGFIWVIHAWNQDRPQDSSPQYMLLLECGDTGSRRQALMHLPSGRRTDFVFIEDPRPLDEHHDGPPLLLALPHDAQLRSDVFGPALYDEEFRELIAPCIRIYHRSHDTPGLFQIAIRRADDALIWGVFDHFSRRFVIPPEYAELLEHKGRWFCRLQGDGIEVRDATGGLLGQHAYNLHYSGESDRLLAEQDGRWGWADSDGCLITALHASSSEALQAEPSRFPRLSVRASSTMALQLDAASLAGLARAVEAGGISVKFEGVPLEGRGDGMLDISHAELPAGGAAYLVEDRWGDVRFLILKQAWRKLAAGSVLALTSSSHAQALDEDSDDSLFLSVALEFIC